MFGMLVALAGTAMAQEPSVAPQVLSPADVALYRDVFAAENAGQFTKAKALFAKVSDTTLAGYVQAAEILSPKSGRTPPAELVAWLKAYRDLPVADRIYRLAVQRATRTVKRGRKRIKVAVVTNIPAPSGVGSRSGGYEDAELPARLDAGPVPLQLGTHRWSPGRSGSGSL